MNTDAAQQNDEKNVADPAEQLAEANEKIARMSQELDSLQIEQKLAHRLAAAGAIDLETALLVAKARIAGGTQADLETCVAHLRKEKPYLFGGSTEMVLSRKTAGAKERGTTNQAALEQAAQKAAQTGSRADLHRYLELRRNRL